jgi:hypothetical protein
MRGTAILAIAMATFVTYTAVADVKRHKFMPTSLRGTWAPSPDDCKSGDRSTIVMSDRTYTSSEAICAVVWVSETAAAQNAIYSAHLRCSKPEERGRKTPSDIILIPSDASHVSIGSSFTQLKDYQRCTD